MSEYTLTITHTRNHCPFNHKRTNNSFCKVCKAWKNPCEGIGMTKTISSKKIDEYTLKQILNTIR